MCLFSVQMDSDTYALSSPRIALHRIQYRVQKRAFTDSMDFDMKLFVFVERRDWMVSNS
jgi:hypothetical protein